MATAKTDKKVETLVSQMETAGEGVPPAREQDAADTAGTTTPRALDLNELQQFSEKKLKALARDLDLYLRDRAISTLSISCARQYQVAQLLLPKALSTR